MVSKYMREGHKILAGLPDRLSPQHQMDLAETLGKVVHTAQAPRLAAGALNAETNWAEVEKRYMSSTPSVIAVDNFLSEEALESLRRFCLESTI